MTLAQFDGAVSFFELYFKALPFVLCLAWTWWVFRNLKSDIAEMKDTYDNFPRTRIILVWVLTLVFVSFVTWFAFVLVDNPRIGFE